MWNTYKVIFLAEHDVSVEMNTAFIFLRIEWRKAATLANKIISSKAGYWGIYLGETVLQKFSSLLYDLVQIPQRWKVVLI